jgi:hypothetical protein
MQTHTFNQQLLKKISGYIAIGAACIVGSFTIGIQTAGDEPTHDRASAYEAMIVGMDAQHDVTPTGGTLQDVLTILRMGESVAISPSTLHLDVNADGVIGTQDAIQLIETLID